MKKIIAVAMAALCLLAVGCSKQDEDTKIDVVLPTTPEPAVTPVPVAEETAEPVESTYVTPYADKIAEQQAKNEETIGWIQIQGTNIDYPIMFDASGKLGYSAKDADGNKSTSGAVYAHFNLYNAELQGVSQNLIVTAHNARVSKTMFHELHHIQEVNIGKTECAYRKCKAALDKATLPDLSTEEGRTWEIAFDGVNGKWEVWSFYEVDEDEPQSTLFYNTWWPADSKAAKYTFKTPDTAFVQEWINKQLERSQMKIGVTPSTTDQFMTIYTCGDNHDSDTAASRLYFFLRLVEPASTKFGGTATTTETATPAA